MSSKIVAYYRVSTKKQERSGLGLDAQRHDVSLYAARTGMTIVGEYTEAESASHAGVAARPQLVAALDHARAARAVLVIAKLDRLLRSVDTSVYIKNSGVPFVACDIEGANEFTIDVLAAAAAQESRAIAARTKAAMAQAKLRGLVFGSPGNLTPDARAKGRHAAATAQRRKREQYDNSIAPVVHALAASGLSQNAIAAELTRRGYETRRCKAWNAVQVGRVLARTAPPSVAA